MMNNDFWSDYHNFAIQIYDPSSSSDDDEKCCWKVLYYCQIEDFQGNGFNNNGNGQQQQQNNNNSNKSPIDWFFPTSSDGGGESSSTTSFKAKQKQKQKQKQKHIDDENDNVSSSSSSSTKIVKDYPLFIGNPYCFLEEEEEEEEVKNNSPWNVLSDDNDNDMYLHVTPETTLLSWDQVKEKEGVNPSKIKEHYDIIEWFVNLSKFQLYLDPTSDEYHEEEEQKQQPQDIMEFNKKDENRLKLQGMEMQSQRKQTYENYLKVFLQRTQFPKDVINDNILPYVGTPTHLRNVRIHYSYGGNDKNNNRNV